MKRRKWDPKTKSTIVLQGLRGRPVGEICVEHQISQAQYYQWRDQFLANMHQIFVGNERREKALTRRECTSQEDNRGPHCGVKKSKRVARMKRRGSALVSERNVPIVEQNKALKAEHTFWDTGCT
jgi:transposase-like protein